ncbi:MAG TPA: glycosyltransferase [Chloroflexota bacterium]|jgi:glycosyltransferase involved in cell wall biosynthesis|nr:glycosyltransferase [Chloroflexota bacterium]
MRVLMASKILVVAAYRRKLEEIASQPGVRLVAVAPPAWREPGGRLIRFEAGPTPGYELRVEPIRFNGAYHLFYWPTLGRVMRQARPDLVHLDEEPYNVATALGTWQAQRATTRSLFFTWQNLLRRYPPPFAQLEHYVLRHSAHAIGGSASAVGVLRRKGYRGPAAVIPQFGVDPNVFRPAARPPEGVPTIGFVARLVEEKGVWVLLEALRELPGDWRVHVIGSGPLARPARRRAQQLGLAARITWEPSVPSLAVADRLRTFSVLVQPSLTRRHWKEQFGRALIEAMACGVAVVGSRSGEISEVIGDAGLLVPEGDAACLHDALLRLLGNPGLRADLGQRGRARVLAQFTHQRVAEQTVNVYQAALECP